MYSACKVNTARATSCCSSLISSPWLYLFSFANPSLFCLLLDESWPTFPFDGLGAEWWKIMSSERALKCLETWNAPWFVWDCSEDGVGSKRLCWLRRSVSFALALGARYDLISWLAVWHLWFCSWFVQWISLDESDGGIIEWLNAVSAYFCTPRLS